MNPLHARIAELQRQVAERDARIRELETALVRSASWIPVEWGLSPCQKSILGLLATREHVTRDAITCLPSIAYATISPDAVNVHIYRLRQRMRPLGVTILSHWGQGYSLAPASRSFLQSVREARQA